ncbi:MAG: hypothetical protein O7F74_01720, partial [Bacteroidetes bacterium]|nr:hypothetical protein [Bacteroidota bacterium]
MKKTTQILIAIALFSLSSASYGQETHTITLNVNTAEIANPNIGQFCNFGQPSTITNENFTIEVNVGDIVVWKGVSSSSPGTDEVKITAINHVGGKNVFDKNVLKDTPQRAGIV